MLKRELQQESTAEIPDNTCTMEQLAVGSNVQLRSEALNSVVDLRYMITPFVPAFTYIHPPTTVKSTHAGSFK